MKLSEFTNAFVELIFPSRCGGCKSASKKPICGDCFEKIEMIEEPLCLYCGKPTVHEVTDCADCRGKKLHFVEARALFVYSGIVKEIIHAFKYERETRLAPVIAEHITRKNWFKDLDIVTFVPLHNRKKIERGFDQAELISKEISKISGIRHQRLLKRDRNTKEQNKLDSINRIKNVSGAFSETGSTSVLDKNILLVDDVYTTGQTISECAKVLKAKGANNVFVAVAAKALFR